MGSALRNSEQSATTCTTCGHNYKSLHYHPQRAVATPHRPTSGAHNVAHPGPHTARGSLQGEPLFQEQLFREKRSQARLRGRPQVNRRRVAAPIAEGFVQPDFWCVLCSPLNLDFRPPKPLLQRWLFGRYRPAPATASDSAASDRYEPIPRHICGPLSLEFPEFGLV